MTDEAKKYFMIGLVIVCVSVAGFILYRSFFAIGNGDTGTDRDTALFCTKCGGFEIPTNKYLEIVSDNPAAAMPMMSGTAKAMPCPKCNQKTCYKAHKCPKCGAIFMLGQAKDRNYTDRCPKCSFSEMEQQKKSQ